ncbi:MAG: YdcF family protein [Solobacterium sp.]|nr:YdcF family protein [Solobacterium sp.]
MKTKHLLILGVVLVLLCLGVLVTTGQTAVLHADITGYSQDVSEYTVVLDPEGIAHVQDMHISDETLVITLRSKSPGRVFAEVHGSDGYSLLFINYVHPLGIMTRENYFGKVNNGRIIPIAGLLYLSLILGTLITTTRREMRENLFRYRNVRHVGLIIYLCFLALQLVCISFIDNGISAVKTMLGAASSFAFFALPAAFVLSIFVTISNLQLIHREGRNWRNLLGCLLGLLICLGTLTPGILGEILQHHYTGIIDVHNEQGIWLYIEEAVEDSISVIMTYLEAILAGTVILAVKAARHIPSFDKDAILILGCQIRKDGTLTPLLKSRTDRAIAFARMQKEKTGKDILFVPSGGQGSDEVIPEAHAIRNYLLASGIPQERIIVEDRSCNTYENMRNLYALMKKEIPDREPRLAFSTTNYHVFRSGILASVQGIAIEGIGSGTRSYFWINAFIREFIATLYSERKAHLRTLLVILAGLLGLVLIYYYSNIF